MNRVYSPAVRLGGVALRENNFGALRLFLATAVIWSHAPQLIDGNFSREPLVAHGGQITLGTLAVDGFFIISGYLIASSFLKEPKPAKFLLSRILRIYPAFVAASLICILIVAPLAGADLSAMSGVDWLRSLGFLLILRPPEVDGAFNQLPISALDGAMWSLRYEFRCYLLVLLLGVIGLLTKRLAILAITGALYAIAAFISLSGAAIPPGILNTIVMNVAGEPNLTFMLTAVFMSGVCLKVFEDQVVYRPALALPLVPPLVAALFLPLPDIAAGTLGAYILLWLAIGVKSRFLQNLNNRYDFSYGTYLYAWPICSLIVLATLANPMSPTMLTVVTTALALCAGAISWYAVEKPALRLKRHRKAAETVFAEAASA